MPLKSTINVDADVEKFQQLQDIFDKYSATLEQQPGLWTYYHHRLQEVNKTAAGLSEFIKEQQPDEAKISRFSAAADRAGRAFRQLERDSKNTAEHLAKSATSLFQISVITGAVFGLLGSGFGVYVLDRAAGQVLERRRTALGLGVSYGQAQAFGTNFGRFGIGEATLGAAATGVYDITSPQYLPMYATGAGRAKNASDAIIGVLERLPQLFANTPENLIGPKAEAYGLTNLLSIQQIVAYLHATPEERQATIEHYRLDSITMNMSQGAQTAWANFDTAMMRAGQNIESILAGALVPLADPLTHLSESAVVLINALIDSGAATAAVKGLTEGIDWLAGEVDNGDAKEAMKSFIKGLDGLVPYITWLGKEFGNIVKWALSLKEEELIPPGYGLPGLYVPTPGGHVFDNVPDTGAPGARSEIEGTGKELIPQSGIVVDSKTGTVTDSNIKGIKPGTTFDPKTGNLTKPYSRKELDSGAHDTLHTPLLPDTYNFAEGGSFKVKGQSGKDANKIVLGLTSGEQVLIIPAGGIPTKRSKGFVPNGPSYEEWEHPPRLDWKDVDEPYEEQFNPWEWKPWGSIGQHEEHPTPYYDRNGNIPGQEVRNHFQGAKTPHAIIVHNETGSSAIVSATRINIPV